MKNWLVILVLFALSVPAQAAVGFGQRKQVASPVSDGAPTSEGYAPAPVATPAAPAPAPAPAAEAEAVAVPAAADLPQPMALEPPASGGASWEKITFAEAETALLNDFRKDAGMLSGRISDLVILDIRATGDGLPPHYRSQLKGELERILVAAESITVKDCAGCMVGRFSRNAQGDWQYQNGVPSTAPAKAAGATFALVAEADYTPENFEIRVRVLHTETGNVVWSKGYSTEELARKAEAETHGEDANGTLLGQRLIGEIAFTVGVTAGVAFMPGISQGGISADMLPYPQVSLLLGEKFDRGSKSFGLKVNAMVMIPTSGGGIPPSPFYIGAGPLFRFTLNPWERRAPRWSFDLEAGALVSANVATGYGGVGVEMLMMQRFSLTVMPIFIVPGSVGGPVAMVENPATGAFEQQSGASPGKVGGFGLSVGMTFNW